MTLFALRRLLPLLFGCLLTQGLAADALVGTPPGVMLPVIYEGGLDVADYLVSEKLDGVRGRWDGHRLQTRAGIWIPAPSWFIENWPQVSMDARLAAVVVAGGEGLVLHRRGAHYHAGRSPDLLKYKTHDDAEARVIGYTPGRGKYTGQLGALVVQRRDGLRFRIGSGFSDEQRAHPPAIGSVVTYRYNGLGTNGVPRFARFLHERHLLPPPDPVR